MKTLILTAMLALTAVTFFSDSASACPNGWKEIRIGGWSACVRLN